MIDLLSTKKKIKDSTIDFYPFEHIVIDNFLNIPNSENFYKELGKVQLLEENQLYNVKSNGYKKQFTTDHGNQCLQELLAVFANEELSQCIANKFSLDKKLFPDNTFEGGGLTFSPPNTFLRYHGDFNYSSNVGKYRVINAILYLNYNYRSEYGGKLHLLDFNSGTVERIVEPMFNRCVLFKTSKETIHGVSKNNKDFTRVSFNAYYYADSPLLSGEIEPHRTLWA